MGDLLAGIPASVITGGGFAGLVFLAFWLVFTGKLIPGKIHEETRTDRDNWRSAYETECEARRLQAAQLNDLLELARTTEALIRALQASHPGERDKA